LLFAVCCLLLYNTIVCFGNTQGHLHPVPKPDMMKRDPGLLDFGDPMALLWALAGLMAGCLLNLLIHRLLRMEKASEPVESFQSPAPRPIYCQSAMLYFLAGRRSRRPGCDSGPERFAWGVELFTALAFGLLYFRFGLDPKLLAASFYSCILMVVFVIDWRRHLIYNVVTYPSMVAAVLLTPFLFGMPITMSLLGLAAGGIIFGGLYVLGRLVFRREALGQGDVDLAMLLGAMMGFPAIVMTLLLTSLIGGIAAVALLVRGRSGAEYMPYGTAMCLGAYATFFLNIPSLF
jgi:leader peptidase (prepilin peptidase)/N-methyltransferase